MKKNVKGNYKLYVILTRTGTRVAKAIRLYTRERYSHVSLSFDEDLDTMYSFARRKIHNPFNAGFIEEHLDSGIFGLDHNVDCAIFCLEFSKRDYQMIRQEIIKLLCHKEEYGYNFPGLILVALNRPYSRPKKFFCSQFVAWIFGRVGISLCDKDYALTRPEDVRKRLEPYMVYEGKLHEYVEYRKKHKDMDDISIKRVEYLKYPKMLQDIIAQKEEHLHNVV